MSVIESIDNLAQLRTYYPNGSNPQDGNIVYVKSHTNYFDGGGGTFMFISAFNYDDDDGVVIKSNYLSNGRWIRQFSGYINVRFYGTIGASQPNDGDRIQKAIDLAGSNFINSYYTKGTVVYIPTGDYRIHNTLILKNGVSIIGDGMYSTFLTAGYPDDPQVSGFPSPYPGSTYDGFMITMEKGRIMGTNISNLSLSGHIANTGDFNPSVIDTKTKGGIYFEAIPAEPYYDGGLWNSTFKNLDVRNFNGNAIWLNGGGKDSGYFAPNQFLIFENVIALRQKDVSHALLLQGEQGQLTFINCSLGGLLYDKDTERGTMKALKGMNVVIENEEGIQTAVVSFINSTFQDAEYGVFIKFAESITFDTCWFENLDMAITASNNNYYPSKAINVLNSRFANASGFGSLNVTNRNNNPSVITGRCITALNSEVNVYNNYVTVTSLSASPPYVDPFQNKVFIMGLPLNANTPNKGIRTIGNSFLDNRLGKSAGINQEVLISGQSINLFDSKIVTVNSSGVIKSIESSINAGETIFIKTNTSIIIYHGNNIDLSGQSTISLSLGDIATFVKVDSQSGIDEKYKLISIM